MILLEKKYYSSVKNMQIAIIKLFFQRVGQAAHGVPSDDI
jgi:hypothetical protein